MKIHPRLWLHRLVPALLGASLLGVSLWNPPGIADEPIPSAPRQNVPDQKEHLSKFMRQKLDANQDVLEGLVTNDFQLILQGADQLQKMSSAEEWRVSNDAMYRQHSREFQDKVQRLKTAAKDQNLDAASLSYVEVSLSCIECHKHVRAMLIADQTFERNLKSSFPSE